MWPRWNSPPIAVRGFPALPARLIPEPRGAGDAPFIRARGAGSGATRARSGTPDVNAAALPWGRRHSEDTGVVRPRGRPPPAHPAPSEAPLGLQAIRRAQSADVAPVVGRPLARGLRMQPRPLPPFRPLPAGALGRPRSLPAPAWPFAPPHRQSQCTWSASRSAAPLCGAAGNRLDRLSRPRPPSRALADRGAHSGARGQGIVSQVPYTIDHGSGLQAPHRRIGA